MPHWAEQALEFGQEVRVYDEGLSHKSGAIYCYSRWDESVNRAIPRNYDLDGLFDIGQGCANPALVTFHAGKAFANVTASADSVLEGRHAPFYR